MRCSVPQINGLPSVEAHSRMNPLTIATELIQCGSETASSNAKCSDLLCRMLQERRFEVRRYEHLDQQGRPKVTLAAVRHGRQPTDSGLAFLSHSDVVSTDGWNALDCGGPFDAKVHQDRLWGRGACDMKGPIASALAAIDRIEEAQQESPIYFFITGDEECGMLGADLLAKRCEIFSTMAQAGSVGIITEPTELRVVNSHKGGCRFKVISHGTAAHSSTSAGLNANWQLIPWLSHLREVSLRVQQDSSLRNELFDPPTLSLNAILRNQPAEFNITPSHASCEVFLRTMPATAWENLVESLVVTAREMGLEVSSVSSLPPLHTSTDCPFVLEALKLTQQSTPLTAGYATDGCRYGQLANLIVLGPGSIDQAHRCDEWISIDQLDRGTKIYHELLLRYCS